MELSSIGISGEIQITDEEDLLSKDDDIVIQFINNTTGKAACVLNESYGTFNIPDGEVASCPTKYSVNGHITYNTETTYNGVTFKNIYFEFKDGKIIKAEAGDKTKELNEILDTDEGSRYIGEFALGLNPYINSVMGDTLFDEKICGSFHFTPGDALEESDNGNRSNIHWDIVCIQTPEYGGGEIYFDDVLVRKDGRFVLPELMQLNPEALKGID